MFENTEFENELTTLEQKYSNKDTIKSPKDQLIQERICNLCNKTDKIKNKSTISVLKETFVEFSKRTDVNCYTKIFEYDNVFVKILWTLVLLLSLSVTAWVLSWTVVKYLDYEVTSQIGVVYELPTDFPAVTLCNANQFNSLESQLLMESIMEFNSLENQWSNLNKLTTMAASSPNLTDTYRKKLGFDKNDFELTCTFNQANCTDDLHWYWHYDYGNCYQFNVGLNENNSRIGLKQTYGAGPQNGLIINISNNFYIL